MRGPPLCLLHADVTEIRSVVKGAGGHAAPLVVADPGTTAEFTAREWRPMEAGMAAEVLCGK